MANEFSVVIHDYLSTKIAVGEKHKTAADKINDSATARYYEGQLRELNAIRLYMAENIDLKTQKYY